YTSIKKLSEKLKRQLLRYRKMQCTYSQVTVSV
ncbi:ribosome hibernation promoting factor, partial [Acinetobacter oleivorans]|nr:ribosome hibernation promoting factor [Acinetobacter oleivorans]